MVTRHVTSTAQPIVWKGRCVWLRHLRADDAKRYAAFHATLDPARVDRGIHPALCDPDEFAGSLKSGIDDIVLAAILGDDSGGSVLGIARAVRDADKRAAEITIVFRPELEGQGLGRLLMGKLVNYCRDCDLLELVGQTTVENRRMIELAHAFRFIDAPCSVPGRVAFRLQLEPSAAE